jgi:hypothetical protein
VVVLVQAIQYKVNLQIILQDQRVDLEVVDLGQLRWAALEGLVERVRLDKAIRVVLELMINL